LPCIEFLQETLAPRFEMVDPGLHGVTILAQFRDGKLTPPTIVDEEIHGVLAPLGFAVFPIENYTGEGVVAVGENIGFNDDLFAERSFYGTSSTVDLGFNTLNDDPISSVSNSYHKSPFIWVCSEIRQNLNIKR